MVSYHLTVHFGTDARECKRFTYGSESEATTKRDEAVSAGFKVELRKVVR